MEGVHPLLLSLAVTFILSFNTALLCDYPNYKKLRYVYLAISGPIALALVPYALATWAKSVCVQVAGMHFAMFLKAIEYGVLEDPSPTPRNYWSYFKVALRETFIPFDHNGAAARADASAAPSKAKDEDGNLDSVSAEQQQLRPQSATASGALLSPQQLLRPPLAAPGTPYPAALAHLLYETALQYMLYDCLLTLCVKPLVGGEPPLDDTSTMTPAPALPPLLSLRSLLASVAFTACLYLHFAISYRIVLLGLSLAWPRLPYACRHQFAAPWRGLTSVSELWRRWHQLFRTTFLRLAYRPARRAARRLHRRLRLAGPHPEGATAAAAGGGGGAAAGGAGGAGVEEAAGVMAVFLLSGLTHEYMCWAAFGTAGGWQLAFFLAHGAAVLAEQAVLGPPRGGGGGGDAASGSRRGGAKGPGGPLAGGGLLAGWARRAASAAFCGASSVVFMRPWLQAGYHTDFWHPVSPAGWALGRLEALGTLGALGGWRAA